MPTALFSDYQNVFSSFTLEMKKENFLNITYAMFFISHTLHTTQTLRTTASQTQIQILLLMLLDHLKLHKLLGYLKYQGVHTNHFWWWQNADSICEILFVCRSITYKRISFTLRRRNWERPNSLIYSLPSCLRVEFFIHPLFLDVSSILNSSICQCWHWCAHQRQHG